MTHEDSNNQSEFFAQFLDDFYAECDEHLVAIRRSLLAFEDTPAGQPIDRTVLDNLFRSFHTLKGISGMVGLTAAEQLAHHLESYLRELREGDPILRAEGLQALLAGVNGLEAVIDAHRNERTIPAIDSVVEQLLSVTTASAATERSESAAAQAQTAVRDEAEQSSPGLAAKRWLIEFVPTAQLSESGTNVNSVRARLQELGEVVQAKPIVRGVGEIAFQFVLVTEADDAIVARLAADGLKVELEALKADAGEMKGRADRGYFSPWSAAPASVVRVDLARLDELMRMVGELVISRTRLDDQLTALAPALPAAAWRQLEETSQVMARQLKNLREGVMRVRMVQVGEIFERMQFVVRDLARESGKKISMQISGSETEIDKFLVERIADPLMHLVRNAVSHGLETTNEREALGKSPAGLLTLSATTRGDLVMIKIADDGRGIDRQRVVARAKATGTAADDSQVDDAALLNLICTPGLSTRDDADRGSGRGVGMDVVKKAVEELGGELSMTTEAGRGTTFTIALPLTLSVTAALIVTVRGQRFAVPQSAVREVMEVESTKVKVLENNEIIAYRGGVLPLVRLARLFEMDYKPQDTFHVFVVGDEANALGVAVDRIVGQREIVVRGITDPLARVNGIAGATELGDQRVVLILDVSAIRQAVLNA